MQRLILKVTLRDISPPIWRRLDVPADISLAQFHRVLQIAMGWTNSHLHEFEQGRDIYGTSDREFGVYRIPETSTRLGDVLVAPKSRINYHYHFGDSWYHAIIVEKVHDDGAEEMRPVVLLGGRRACPPEDCGGSHGYQQFLTALGDPTHAEHRAFTEWIGGTWDAERVPSDTINRRLARLKLKAVRPSTRRTREVATPQIPSLASFLSAPERPGDTLTYHELQGFLFAVAAAPDLVMPSEWLPMVFGGQAPSFDNDQDAEAVTQAIMAVYNDVTARARSERATLPDDCAFRDDVMSNLEHDAPISAWSRGFSRGHQWLIESWDPYVPDDDSNDLGLQLMVLGFFSSRRIAEAFAREIKRSDVAALAQTACELFPHALAEYARYGRVIETVLARHPAPVRREGPKVGRNALCPCGSGRKYKKCCGAAV